MKHIPLLLLSLAVAASIAPARAENQPSELFMGCTEFERFRFNDALSSDDTSQISDAVSGKWTGAEIYRLGFRLAQSKNDELREMGEYLKGRAYYKEGLIHVAYEKFIAYLSKPADPYAPLVGKMGAIQCVNSIQQAYPTLGFTKETVDQIVEYAKRKDVTSRDWEHLGRALVVRMKELINRHDPKEGAQVLAVLKAAPAYLRYAQAMMYQRLGDFKRAVPLWKELIEDNKLPATFAEDRDAIIMLYARDLYESGDYEKSGETLRMIPRDSNYLAQALSDLSWALLMSGKKREAIGAAFNIQKSLLTRVYAPEAPLVASIALQEMCQYARALKNAVFFKKKYYPLLIWYKKLSPEQLAKPYQLLVGALRRKAGVPNVVLLEWLRSPEYRAYQAEANLYFEEKRLAYQQYAQRVVAEKGAAWPREYKYPLPKFYNGVDRSLKQETKRMNDVLGFLTQRMAKQVAKIVENVQLLEIEIYDSAGEDMVWRNVNPEYPAWLALQEEEKRPKDLYWEWGQIAVDPKSRDEVWEDELGWTLGNVSDECKAKQQFRDQKTAGKTVSQR